MISRFQKLEPKQDRQKHEYDWYYLSGSDEENDIQRNKSAQSNLGRGPRRGAVAHVRRKVPIGYNGAPQIRPQ